MLSYEEYKKVYNITQNEYIDEEKKIEKILKKRYTSQTAHPHETHFKIIQEEFKKEFEIDIDFSVFN